VRSVIVDDEGDNGPRSRPVAGQTAEGAPPTTHRPNRRHKAVRVVLEVLVLAAAAPFVALRAGNLTKFSATFDHLHWHWLFVSVAAEIGSITMLSWFQHRLLRVGDLPVTVANLLPVTMASNAVAQSLPAGSLFAEGYAFRQYQRLGASRALGIWAELSAGALAAAALAGVAVAGAAVTGPALRLQLLPILAFVFAGALVAAALFRRAPLLGSLLGRALRGAQRLAPQRVCRLLRSAQESTREMECFRPSWGVWLTCLAGAALNWCLDALVLLMGLLTVGAPVPWRGFLLCYAAAQLLVELPITPGGLGLVEGGLVVVLTRFHVAASSATAATLMYRAVSYWLLLLVGWVAVLWLTLRNRQADRAASAASSPAAASA
jgi:uncharacterized protein (TIRG00374 family)